MGDTPLHQTMFLGQPTRPHIGAQILQRFRFAQPPERIAYNRFDQLKRGTTPSAENCMTLLMVRTMWEAVHSAREA